MFFDNIVIYGAGGFIGDNLWKCIEQHFKVNIFLYDINPIHIDGSDGRVSNISKDELFLLLQNSSEKTLVYYLANKFSPSDSMKNASDSVAQNVVNFVEFLEITKNNAANIRVVFSSSGGTVYSEKYNDEKKTIKSELSPRSIYAANKIAQEYYLDVYKNVYGLDVKIARISNPFGPGQRVSGGQGLIAAINNSIINDTEFYIFGDGDERRDYIYIDDLCRALVALAEYEGKVTHFNIASGTTKSTLEVLNAIEKAWKRKIRCRQKRALSSSVKKISLSVEEEKRLLNWEPNTSFEDGIRATINALKSQQYLIK